MNPFLKNIFQLGWKHQLGITKTSNFYDLGPTPPTLVGQWRFTQSIPFYEGEPIWPVISRSSYHFRESFRGLPRVEEKTQVRFSDRALPPFCTRSFNRDRAGGEKKVGVSWCVFCLVGLNQVKMSKKGKVFIIYSSITNMAGWKMDPLKMYFLCISYWIWGYSGAMLVNQRVLYLIF